MAVDTPAKIAILGAGPIGLEAALYARYLGYEAVVYERGNSPVAELARHAHARLYTSFSQLSSPLGLAALITHDATYLPPEQDRFLTVGEWCKEYLLPLAQTDLLTGCMRTGCSVKHVGKVELTKLDHPTGEHDRGNWDFRLFLENANGNHEIHTADIVFDCTGVTGQPLPVGHGGLPALGECSEPEIQKRIAYHLPDFFDADRARYAGKTVLVVGDHPLVAQAVLALHELQMREAGGKIVWVTRHAREQCASGPLTAWLNHSVAEMRQLFLKADELAISGAIDWRAETWVEAIEWENEEQLRVLLGGETEEALRCDQILGYNGFVPSHAEFQQLSLEICAVSDCLEPFSQPLLEQFETNACSLGDLEYAPGLLISSEPNFYRLGEKSFGRFPGFTFTEGLRQIQKVFTLIADRENLDLYANHRD